MSTEFRKALPFIETEVPDEHHELEVTSPLLRMNLSHRKPDCLLGYSNVDDIISNALLVEGEALSWRQFGIVVITDECPTFEKPEIVVEEGRGWVSEKDRFRNILKNKVRIDEDNLFENIEYENRVWFGKLSALAVEVFRRDPVSDKIWLASRTDLMERIINNPSKNTSTTSAETNGHITTTGRWTISFGGNQPISVDFDCKNLIADINKRMLKRTALGRHSR
ncbi:hypothetical protein V1504DRAFT_434548 [Lipomyces starkeyi]